MAVPVDGGRFAWTSLRRWNRLADLRGGGRCGVQGACPTATSAVPAYEGRSLECDKLIVARRRCSDTHHHNAVSSTSHVRNWLFPDVVLRSVGGIGLVADSSESF